MSHMVGRAVEVQSDSLWVLLDVVAGAAAGVDRVSNGCVRSRHEMVTKVMDDSIGISFTTPNWSKATRAISVVSVITCYGSLYFRCNRRRYHRDPCLGRCTWRCSS